MCEVKDIITDDLVVIEGHDFTDDVNVVDGHIECMMCHKIVEDNNDLDIYEFFNGERYVGHDDCVTGWYLDD